MAIISKLHIRDALTPVKANRILDRSSDVSTIQLSYWIHGTVASVGIRENESDIAEFYEYIYICELYVECDNIILIVFRCVIHIQSNITYVPIHAWKRLLS